MPDTLHQIPFSSQTELITWLENNHLSSQGIWLKLAKKTSGIPTVTYDEAVEAGLCYGWIDGQKKGLDEAYWLQRFTPRQKKSAWSLINKNRILKLIKEKKVKPQGLLTIQWAKESGAWEKAYAPQSKMEIPPDFQKALNKNKKAKIVFGDLDSAARYSILYKLQAGSEKTRETRIKKFITTLENKQKVDILFANPKD